MPTSLQDIIDYALTITPNKLLELGYPIEQTFQNANDRFMQNGFFAEGLDDHVLWSYDVDSKLWESIKTFLLGGIVYNIVDSYGGEGEGEKFYYVYKFTNTYNNDVVYVKFDGSYASHYGSTYHDYHFVNAVQKTITVYE